MTQEKRKEKRAEFGREFGERLAEKLELSPFYRVPSSRLDMAILSGSYKDPVVKESLMVEFMRATLHSLQFDFKVS